MWGVTEDGAWKGRLRSNHGKPCLPHQEVWIWSWSSWELWDVLTNCIHLKCVFTYLLYRSSGMWSRKKKVSCFSGQVRPTFPSILCTYYSLASFSLPNYCPSHLKMVQRTAVSMMGILGCSSQEAARLILSHLYVPSRDQGQAFLRPLVYVCNGLCSKPRTFLCRGELYSVHC